MRKSSPQSAVIGASGEHLVLSNLLRLNFIAGKAPDNTKDYDLIVLNKDGTSSSPIQVKTTLNKRKGWILQEKHETPIKNLVFCFVCMEKDSSETEIYVIDAKTVAYVVKTSHKIWLKLSGLKGQKHNPTSIRHLSPSGIARLKNLKDYLTKSELEFLNKYSDGWLVRYRDAWHLIGDK